MEFSQLDRIVRLDAPHHITATRLLRAEEKILKDHFPLFPVMPGVLMLEACYQAGMYLVLESDGFEHPMVMLKAARNVKYSDFVAPGQTLTVTMDVVKQEDLTTTFKARGEVSGPDKPAAQAFTARLVLERFRLADRYPHRAVTDGVLRCELRKELELLTDPQRRTA
jgi:3-hydroxyacyl-[acyl-carrier-protein] dehydratase